MDPEARLKQLGEMAKVKAKVNHNYTPNMYLRSAIQLEQQARSYYEDEDWVNSYILSVRFCHLVLQELPAHPKYKEVPKVEKDRARKKVKVMLERAEELKKKLNNLYMAEYEEKKREELQQRREELQQRREEEKRKVEEEQQRQHQLREQQRLLEEQEMKRAEEERQRLEQKRRDEEIAAAMATAAITQPPPYELSSSAAVADGHHGQSHHGLTHLPTVNNNLSAVAQSTLITPGMSPVVDRSSKPTHLIQQEPYPNTQLYPQQDKQDVPPSQPIVDRSTKPVSHDPANSDVFLRGIETLQATGGLRMVHVPENLAQQFLTAASSNTRRNVETGGFLAGKLSRNTFRITHLILPQQEGNADNFVTRNEEQYFEVMEQYDLIQLGWIHTHPSQTSFLSSVDLHLQLYHQGMLEEAIAIVAAPKYSQTGYYQLTSHGLEVIGSCQQTGFHPHAKHPPLFEDCKHVHHEPAANVTVVDLRGRQ